jgi:hypothetical protein
MNKKILSEIDAINGQIANLEDLRKQKQDLLDRERASKAVVTAKAIKEKLNELETLLRDSGFDYNIRGGISTSPQKWADEGWPDIGVEFYNSKWVSSWC